ncbi:MAG: hypothetical protein JNL90_11325 [Planctomycetes bacterium]|nr:hypothetical protein [Planctomycetota bacterium]
MDAKRRANGVGWIEPRAAAGRRSSRGAALLPALALLFSGCASESRLWRITPFSSTSGDERVNGFPFLYTDGSATAVLWPLIDFDRDGFAVRPLISKDESEWDVVWPLSHWDTRTGDGWALTAYSCGESRGLFPLFHVGPEFNYVGPAWWNERDGEVQSSGLFPIAWWDAEHGDGLLLNAYSWQGNRGLFPLCNFGPSLDWVGPAWWKSEGDAVTDWGVLPLGYRDRESGDGYLLNAYSFGESRGLFPLFHMGPEFNFVGPAWWHERDGAVDSCGLFPLAWIDAHDGDALFLNAYSIDGNRGLFPLCNVGDELSFVGPFWWSRASGEGERGESGVLDRALADGAAPLAEGTPAPLAPIDAFGCFPLAWATTDDDSSSLALLPLWYQRLEPDHELRAALLPPTWWEDEGETQRHLVLPFYAHLADADASFTLVAPFFASREDADGSSWWTLLANGWHEGAESGLNLYPLWWSSQRESESLTQRESSRMLLPLFLDRRRGHERLLLTPLGGRGWDESGATTFTNFLGPLFHHSRGPDSESTALLWPLFQHESRGDTTEMRAFPLFDVTVDPAGHDAFALAGLARDVAQGESRSFRLWPLWSDVDLATADGESPDLLYELTLAGRRTAAAQWSNHLFPLWFASGDDAGSEASALAGLARVATTEQGHAWRLFPLASASTDAAADGWLDDWTLARFERREQPSPDSAAPAVTTSARLFPLFHHESSPSGSESRAALGLARVATTDAGHAWRLFPLASASTDAAADGWLDDWTLARYERREQPSPDGAAPAVTTAARLFPLFHHESSPSGSESCAALGLARVATTDAGHAWRLFPLASASTDAAADGWLDDWTLARYEQRDSGAAWRLWPLVSKTASEAPRGPLDLITLVGVDRDSSESSLHLATPLVFDLDRRRDGSGWEARVLSLLHFGREEHAVAPATPGVLQRRHAGFLFDWFKAEQRVVADLDGATREESHYRLPFLHEYEREGETTEWDALCYAVHSVDTPDESRFSVLGYAYRSVRTGDATQRDIFPFITCDDAPDKKRVSFLWRLFEYERQGDQVGGHLLFIPWGDSL